MIMTQQVLIDQNQQETIVSEKVDSSNMSLASFQLILEDSETSGELRIEGSNQMVVGDRQSFSPTEWSNLAYVSINSGKSNILVIPNLCCQFIRAVFVPTVEKTSSVKLTMNSISEA